MDKQRKLSRLEFLAKLLADYCFTKTEFDGTARGATSKIKDLEFGAGFKNCEIWANYKGHPCLRYKMHESVFFPEYKGDFDRLNLGNWELIITDVTWYTVQMKEALVKRNEAKKAMEDKQEDELFASFDELYKISQ
jgi:methionine aminopeptidase